MATNDDLKTAREEYQQAVKAFNSVWFNVLFQSQQELLFPPLMHILHCTRKLAILQQVVEPEATLYEAGKPPIKLV